MCFLIMLAIDSLSIMIFFYNLLNFHPLVLTIWDSERIISTNTIILIKFLLNRPKWWLHEHFYVLFAKTYRIRTDNVPKNVEPLIYAIQTKCFGEG